MKNIDKAGKEFWDRRWTVPGQKQGMRLEPKNVHNYLERRFHGFFHGLFANKLRQQQKLLEIGCAHSVWLPYFSKRYGFKVSGIDYSVNGCRQAEEVLRNEGVEGKIVCADAYAPPLDMMNIYDVVVSFGVVEHYTETTNCLSRFAKFLKKDGLMVTVIPNMCGIVGFLQKFLDRTIYRIHHPINLTDLQKAHEQAGLEVLDSSYFLAVNFGVVRISSEKEAAWAKTLKRVIGRFVTRLSKIMWILEEKGLKLPESPSFSPYLVCVSKKR